MLNAQQFPSAAKFNERPVEQPVADQGALFFTEPPLDAPPKQPLRNGRSGNR